MRAKKPILCSAIAAISSVLLTSASMATAPLVIPGEYTNVPSDTYPNATFANANKMPVQSDSNGGAGAIIYADKFTGYQNLKPLPQGDHTFFYKPPTMNANVEVFLYVSYTTPKGNVVSAIIAADSSVTKADGIYQCSSVTDLKYYQETEGGIPKNASNPQLLGIMDYLWSDNYIPTNGETQSIFSSFSINNKALRSDLQDNLNGYKNGFFAGLPN
jgi:hypothetical protein